MRRHAAGDRRGPHAGLNGHRPRILVVLRWPPSSRVESLSAATEATDATKAARAFVGSVRRFIQERREGVVRSTSVFPPVGRDLDWLRFGSPLQPTVRASAFTRTLAPSQDEVQDCRPTRDTGGALPSSPSSEGLRGTASATLSATRVLCVRCALPCQRGGCVIARYTYALVGR